MAYTPTVWNCGDTITAEKLNKLENGLADCCGGGAALIVREVSSREAAAGECASIGVVRIYSRTWQELKDAYDAGLPVYLQVSLESEGASFAHRYPLIQLVTDNEDTFDAYFIDLDSRMLHDLSCPTATGALEELECSKK